MLQSLTARHSQGTVTPMWASQLSEILPTVEVRPDLREAMRFLLAHHEIPVKVTEGGDRRARRIEILDALFAGALTLDQAVTETERRLARDDSPHADSNLVFARGWARRLIETHTSVFYSWTVLEALLAAGATRCVVPHSAAESSSSTCATMLAGREHEVRTLRDRLVEVYVAKRRPSGPLVPNHPHCTHVVAPVTP